MTNKDIFKEIGYLEPTLVLEAAPSEETDRKKQFVFPKKLMALAASLLLVVGLLSFVGFDNVYAAVQKLFAFIPGVGIEEIDERRLYTADVLTDRVAQEGMTVELLRANYYDNTLSMTVSIRGRSVSGELQEVLSLYRDGLTLRNADGTEPRYLLFTDGDSALVDITVFTAEPAAEDKFEIQLDGIKTPLAFAMKSCETVESIREIGPTATQNGITLAVTSHRVGNELVVWYYEMRSADATRDDLLSYGASINASYELQAYIETESGRIYDDVGGWKLMNRRVFALSDTDTSATLHVPYLTMTRDESARLKLKLSADYGVTACDAKVKTSLGTIRITEAERTESGDRDRLMLRLSYDSKSETERLYAFKYALEGDMKYAASHSNSDAGTVEYIEVYVAKGQKNLDIEINGLYYYLFGEYVLPLEIS